MGQILMLSGISLSWAVSRSPEQPQWRPWLYYFPFCRVNPRSNCFFKLPRSPGTGRARPSSAENHSRIASPIRGGDSPVRYSAAWKRGSGNWGCNYFFFSPFFLQQIYFFKFYTQLGSRGLAALTSPVWFMVEREGCTYWMSASGGRAEMSPSQMGRCWMQAQHPACHLPAPTQHHAPSLQTLHSVESLGGSVT